MQLFAIVGVCWFDIDGFNFLAIIRFNFIKSYEVLFTSDLSMCIEVSLLLVFFIHLANLNFLELFLSANATKWLLRFTYAYHKQLHPRAKWLRQE